jgi:tetratricopeptide (TPR) repeat protein
MEKSILFLMIFLISACSPSANEYNYQANQAFRDGNYTQALRKYQQAQVESPDDMIYYFNAGLAYAELGQLNQALSALEIARLKVDPENENADIYYNLGVIYAQIGRYQDAIGAFRSGLSMNPEHEDMRYNLEAVLLLSQDEPTTFVDPPASSQPLSSQENDNISRVEQLTFEQALAILEQVEQSQQVWRYFEQIPVGGSQGDAW